MLATLEGHAGGIRGVALSADGRLLASGGLDGTIRLWSLDDIRRDDERMPGMQESPFVGRKDIRRADGTGLPGQPAATPSGATLRATLQGHTGLIYDVALNEHGQLLASVSFDGSIRLWATSGGVWLRTLRRDRRYERVDITGLTGVTEAQRKALIALGALERTSRP